MKKNTPKQVKNKKNGHKNLREEIKKHTTERTRDIKKHVDKRISEDLLSKTEYFGSQFKHHITTAIIAALSFLVALSWKDLVVHFMTTVTSKNIVSNYPYIPDLYSALIITIISVFGIAIITKWARKPEIISR
jgi:hypothetical protein